MRVMSGLTLILMDQTNSVSNGLISMCSSAEVVPVIEIKKPGPNSSLISVSEGTHQFDIPPPEQSQSVRHESDK